MEWIIGIVVLVFVASLFKPRSCDICGADFKKKYFTWEIEGKKQHLCPYCNGKMSRRKSDQKFKDRFG
ncbi:Uncharacterised protein [Yersinia massiliensis]|uniref:hypothetical protein n=1 Tax=Yersinia massiliensis TaxID=419257 RepID=UPI0005E382E9|nr:hypothetical protein [Yersinia massiliensis]CNI67183.1 Uncharacterised protein [Yersinia massiliensis]HDY4931525.1 hypothetical protein [Yersinia enterocolitica]